MKILHAVFGEQFYGSERYCIELATAQALRGEEVAVLIRGADSFCAQQFRHSIAATGTGGRGGPRTVRLVAMPRSFPAMLHRPFASAALRGFRPEIVHTHLNPAARRVGRVAQRLGIPHVATLHIRYDAREHAGCDGLICTASWQRRDIPANFTAVVATIAPWLPDDIHRALHAVDAGDIEALRRAWRAGANITVFGSVGRLMPEKGMDVLVRAFRLAFPSGTEPVALVVIGEGPQDLRAAAAGDTRITIAGAQGDIARCYRAFDVYVSAARFEPFGLTILEGMDAGCALIVTRTEGPREFLKDARVLWADPDDVDSLARQLTVAATRGRERLAYDLTPYARGTAAQAIEEFYRDVVKRSRADRGQ
jgi:glycosyltransferase involved in cell wall biosynthesis